MMYICEVVMKFAAGRFSRPLQPVKTGRHTKRQGVRIDLLLIAGLLGLMLIGTIAGPLAYRALSAPEHGPLPATPSQPAFVLSTGNEKAIADLRARMDAADASAVKYRAQIGRASCRERVCPYV